VKRRRPQAEEAGACQTRGPRGAQTLGQLPSGQAACAIEPSEEISRSLFPFLRVAFNAARNGVAIGIASLLRPRHNVVRALCVRGDPSHTVEAMSSFARVDRHPQRPVLQKIRLFDTNRRPAARALFLGGATTPASITHCASNLVGWPHFHHVPRLAPLHQTQYPCAAEPPLVLAHRRAEYSAPATESKTAAAPSPAPGCAAKDTNRRHGPRSKTPAVASACPRTVSRFAGR
jgi:hypothetical protein